MGRARLRVREAFQMIFLSLRKILNCRMRRIYILIVISMIISTSQCFLRNFAARTASTTLYSRAMSVSAASKNPYFNLPAFAIVGASTDREKFGNKVLRCMVDKKLQVFPINKKTKEIEGIQCVSSLSDLQNVLAERGLPGMVNVGINIITPPGVTLGVLKEGYALGGRHFYLQPGTYDAEVDKLISSNEMQGARVVKSCVLIELGCH